MCKILIKHNNQFYYAFIRHFETFIPTTVKKNCVRESQVCNHNILGEIIVDHVNGRLNNTMGR
jgi:hypothetical protein